MSPDPMWMVPLPTAPAPAELVPLTHIQLVYLTRHLLDPTDLTSHCLLTWVVDGWPDQTALAAAVAAVHRRHEPLRAAYRADPSPVAQVVDVDPPPLESVPDQPSVDAAIAALRTLLAGELLVEEGDVWRVAVVPAGSRTVIGCVVHHIAFDGCSEAVLARDLATAYNAAVRGEDPAMTMAVPRTLADTHRRYQRRIAHSALDQRRERDRADLADVPALRWPKEPAPPDAGGPGVIEASLPAGVRAAVRERVTETGASRFTVLLAEYAAAFAEATGERDFTVGVPVAPRPDPDVDDAIGCHTAMTRVRLRGAALRGGVDGVRAVGRLVGAARTTPDVHDLLSPAGGPLPPLFQTLFSLRDDAPVALPLANLRTTFVRQPCLDLPLDLHTEVWSAGDGGLTLTVSFRPDTVARSAAEVIARRYEERLCSGVPGRLS
ncbi:condensation domain-containing protein [Actinomycetes bacterium KLBMP 9797]